MSSGESSGVSNTNMNNQTNSNDYDAALTSINNSLSSEDEAPHEPDPDQLSGSMQPRLRAHPDESVAYATVSDPVQHTEGLKGKYTVYRIAYDPPPPTADGAVHTSAALFPYATSCYRRYSDFSWLFDHLHKERPGAIVPPLPEKQQVSRFSESFIEDRRFHLEIFLRRVVCNPELKDTECLLVFLGGGDEEFKKAKKDGSFGKFLPDAGIATDYDDTIELNSTTEHDSKLSLSAGKEILSNKKSGLKKWIKEKKTTMKGSMIRSPDDAVFEEVEHYISALEAGLKRVDAQATAMMKRDKDASTSLLEFGLGCDALGHIDDEVNGGEGETAKGIGQTFRMVGKTADALSVLSHDHFQREMSCFHEPLRDHLKMVNAVKVALSKRNNRRITYSTCVNQVDSKKASLHKYRITPGMEAKTYSAESSLARAESAVEVARANYEEVSQRVLREVDRFKKENSVVMHETMLEFARSQKEHSEKMNDAWGSLLPQLESVKVAEFTSSSFAQAAASLMERKHGSSLVSSATKQMQEMGMPSYPPPVEPAGNNTNGLESSMLNGAVRYRDLLPEE